MKPQYSTLQGNERVMLACVMLTHESLSNATLREYTFAAGCTEAEELVRATGGELVCVHTAKRDKPHTALFIGTGKAEEWAKIVQEQQIDLVVFNHELSPTQERNLEKILQCRVLDRVGLILAIFAQRAQSQEGKLQVELAQLNHLSSRLIRGYTHLQSQKGGIGLKGPGETKLETDRRLIQTKITQLRRQLTYVKKQRHTQRQARLNSPLPIWAIVGYTNAGKSTLFNRLSKAQVLTKDQLFATLDTTARRVYLAPQKSIILTDTVGFIQDLPHKLIEAFSATLEETTLAHGLLHVVDASDPDWERKIDDVNHVLTEIGADNIPQIFVFHKIDLLPEHEQTTGLVSSQMVRVSATSGVGLDDLRQLLISGGKHE